MKKDKIKNIIIISLSVIVIILIIFIIMILNSNIYRTENVDMSKNENKEENSLTDAEIKEETNNNIDNGKTNEEININIFKEYFESLKTNYSIARTFFDNFMYCGTYSENFDRKGIVINNTLYTLSEQFTTFKELKSYLNNYMTDNTLNSKWSLFKEFYYEKDNSLYCNTGNKGSNINKITFLEEESIFKINNIEEEKIEAEIYAVYLDIGNDKTYSKVNITMIKEEDNWLIDYYEEIN